MCWNKGKLCKCKRVATVPQLPPENKHKGRLLLAFAALAMQANSAKACENNVAFNADSAPIAQTTDALPVSPIGLRISRDHSWTLTNLSRFWRHQNHKRQNGHPLLEMAGRQQERAQMFDPQVLLRPTRKGETAWPPTLEPDPSAARHRLAVKRCTIRLLFFESAEERADGSSPIEQRGHVSDRPWTFEI
jgi:hypothetical protein